MLMFRSNGRRTGELMDFKHRVYKVGKLTIHLTKRRKDQRTWFSISPLLIGKGVGKVRGVGIYGPKNGIIVDWTAFSGKPL